MKMQIVVLDGHTLNPGDLSWAPLAALGELAVYPHSSPGEVVERADGAAAVLVNKVVMDAAVLARLPALRYLGVTATGYNNVDVPAARARGVRVTNVSGYGAQAVAQHVFALLLALINRVETHHASVAAGQWSAQPYFSYQLSPITELAGKRLGIYGLGQIGQAVARIGQAFGMEVWATHKHPTRDAMPGVRFVDLPTLFASCQVVSLHAPLTPDNAGIVDAALLARMPPGSYLLNTARGALIQETDLAQALRQGALAGAGLDVLSAEPPPPDHPLLHLPNCLVTPHLAWAAREARARLLADSVENVAAWIRGEERGVVG